MKRLSCLPWPPPPSAPGKGAGQCVLSPSFVPWALPWKRSLWPACTGHWAAAGRTTACLVSAFGDQNAGLPLPRIPRANPQPLLSLWLLWVLLRHVTRWDLYPWLVAGGGEALLLRATLNCAKNRLLRAFDEGLVLTGSFSPASRSRACRVPSRHSLLLLL